MNPIHALKRLCQSMPRTVFLVILARSLAGADEVGDITISRICESAKTQIELPLAYHGGYEPSVPGAQNGITPASLARYRSFFGRQIFYCDKVIGEFPIEVSFKYKAHVSYFKPKLDAGHEILNAEAHNFLTEKMGIFSTVVLFLFSAKLFQRKRLLSGLSGILFSAYSFFSIAGVFGIKLSMMSGHKMADVALWVGVVCLSKSVIKNSKFEYLRILILILGFAIVLAVSGDRIQNLAYLAFLPSIILLLEIAIFQKWRFLKIAFVFGLLSPDLYFVTFDQVGPMILPIGLGILLIASQGEFAATLVSLVRQKSWPKFHSLKS